MDNYGILSLIPPILAIILAWRTKEVILSLFIGVFAGAVIIAGYNPITGFIHTVDKYMLGSLAGRYYPFPISNGSHDRDYKSGWWDFGNR